jgi:sporulation protein YtfJ
MENQSSLKDIINNSLHNIRNIIDAETVVGEQIRLDNGMTIIPISKISVGFASGGLDLPTKNEKGSKNFGGGGGTGVSVSPIGFLTVYPDGKVEVVPISPAEMGPIDQISEMLNRAPEIIGSIRAAFADDETEEDDSVTFED